MTQVLYAYRRELRENVVVAIFTVRVYSIYSLTDYSGDWRRVTKSLVAVVTRDDV